MACVDMGQGLHGITATTSQNLILDVGVAYRDIDIDALRAVGSTQLQDALAGATILGATRGGMQIATGKDTRHIEVDGRRFNIKGLQRIDLMDTTFTINFLEQSLAVVRLGLTSFTEVAHTAFNELTPNLIVACADYIDNIAIVTSLANQNTPIVFVAENCLNIASFELSLEDTDEAVLAVTFTAHAAEDTPSDSPFHIFHPTNIGS